MVEVVEVVVKVMVEMGEVTVVERRSLPQDGFFPDTFSLLPLFPLSLLLFRFVIVSMSSVFLFLFLVFLGDGAGVAGVLGVAGFFWVVGFFGVAVIVAGAAGDSVDVLFQTIQFSMSTQFNCQKHFYFKLFSLVKQF